MDIAQQLNRIGLSAKGVDTYLSLLEMGRGTAYQLAKKMSVPRATVYFVLDELIQKGLISSAKKQSTTIFTPNPPAALLRLTEGERDEAARRVGIARGLVDLLGPIFERRAVEMPRLQFVEGREAVHALLQENEEAWHQSMLETDCTWWGFDDTSLFANYSQWFKQMWVRREELRRDRIYVNVFSNVAVASSLRERWPKTKLRPFPEGYDFTSTLWLCGNFVIVIASRRTHYALQLRDPLLAESIRFMFRMLWNAKVGESKMES